MYREKSNRKGDSGWRFFSGTETEEYINNHKNTNIFDVNTIANYDQTIIDFLDEPAAIVYERSSESDWHLVTDFEIPYD